MTQTIPTLEDNVRRALIDHRKGFMESIVTSDEKYGKALILAKKSDFPDYPDGDTAAIERLENIFLEVFQKNIRPNWTSNNRVWRAYFKGNPSIPAAMMKRLDEELVERCIEKSCAADYDPPSVMAANIAQFYELAGMISRVCDPVLSSPGIASLPELAQSLTILDYRGSQVGEVVEDIQDLKVPQRNEPIIQQIALYAKQKNLAIPPLPETWPSIVRQLYPTIADYLRAEEPPAPRPVPGFIKDLEAAYKVQNAPVERARELCCELTMKTSQAQANWIYGIKSEIP